jgi:hypothetical protein
MRTRPAPRRVASRTRLVCCRADNNHGLCHDLASGFVNDLASGLVNDLASGLANGLARPSDLASDLARTIVYGLESAMVTWSGACLWS